jgi:hypothetical protein
MGCAAQVPRQSRRAGGREEDASSVGGQPYVDMKVKMKINFNYDYRTATNFCAIQVVEKGQIPGPLGLTTQLARSTGVQVTPLQFQ